jgi:abortive infection bacteriophage resistance protein
MIPINTARSSTSQDARAGFLFMIREMLSTYKKPHLPFNQQLNLLKARGLEVSNDNAALAYLTRIGYYRLSAYWYPLRLPLITQDPITQKIKVSRQDKFCPGIKFENTLSIYVFDKRLRLLLLDAIERVEIAMRVDISHILGTRDTFAHTNASMLHGNFTKKIRKTVLLRTKTGSRNTTRFLHAQKRIFLNTIRTSTGCLCPFGYP